MQIRVITMRYNDGLQGFPEDALRQATFGRTMLDVTVFSGTGSHSDQPALRACGDEHAQSGRPVALANAVPDFFFSETGGL